MYELRLKNPQDWQAGLETSETLLTSNNVFGRPNNSAGTETSHGFCTTKCSETVCTWSKITIQTISAQIVPKIIRALTEA